MTHRNFSRNAQSSRAVPLKRSIEFIEQNPAIPISWGKSEKGMQSTQELKDQELETAKQLWDQSRLSAIEYAKKMQECKLSKQLANRILEPWAHINVVVSATNWKNFFHLRCDDMAQPEIQELANQMRGALRSGTPTPLKVAGWHLPYILEEEKTTLSIEDQRKCSVARCARVSYKTFDTNKLDPVKDIELHDALLKDRHLSPFEHVATPWENVYCGNLFGWKQYRKFIPNESGE